MKLIKILITMLAAGFVVGFVGCSKDDTTDDLRRDTDAVSLGYNANATTQFTVRYHGAWKASVVCYDKALSAEDKQEVEAWLTLDKTEGAGNGRDYDYVTLTAQRNAGAVRGAVVYLTSAAGQSTPIQISVEQANGEFSITNPTISGTLKSKSESNAMIEIAYDKAFGTETLEVAVELGGASAGLSVKPLSTFVIDSEGSGRFSIPIAGTPTSIGSVDCKIVAKLDGKVLFDDTISASIASNNTIWSFGFDLFIWGGHYLENQAGPTPTGKQVGKDYTGSYSDPGTKTVSAGTDGASDAFNTMPEAYRVARDIVDWAGRRVYEHPGYIKIGTGGGGGWVQTPALKDIGAQPTTIVVSFDIMRLDAAVDDLLFSVEGAGVLEGSGLITNNMVPAGTSSTRKWKKLTYTISDATSATSLKWSAANESSSLSRFNIDNIAVMGSEIEVVVAPLETPVVECEPTENSLELKWEHVASASHYEVKYWQLSKPNVFYIDTTEKNSYTFEELEKSTMYCVSVTAIYAPKAEFNSKPFEGTFFTAAERTKPLETPVGVANVAAATTTSQLKFSWSAVKYAMGYAATLTDLSDATAAPIVKNIAEGATEALFDELKPATSYSFSVVALYTPNPTYNSAASASVSATTATPIALPAPVVSKYALASESAVVAWSVDYSTEPTNSYNIELTDNSGQVLRSYPRWTIGSGDFAKCSKHGIRMLLGGLTPSTTYTVRIQRVTSLEGYSDSAFGEWSFTTDAAVDKSGYLLYKDFDNHWWGGSYVNMAYGVLTKTVDSPDVTKLSYARCNPWTNMSNICTGVGSSAEDKLWYHATFMAEWPESDLAAQSTSGLQNVYLTGGAMKFGTGGSYGTLTLPLFKSLTGATTIVLEFNTAPYYEPNKTTGSLEVSPATADGKLFRVKVAEGNGTIVSATNQERISDDRTDVVMTHKNPGEQGADTQGRYVYTHQKVVISGVDAQTRIAIATASDLDGKRIIFDDLTVKVQ